MTGKMKYQSVYQFVLVRFLIIGGINEGFNTY